jgi:hypothetical protein
MDQKAVLKGLCDELLQAASKSLSATAPSDEAAAAAAMQAFVDQSSQSLIKLKCFNRNVQVSLEEQKKEIDSKRLKVDTLQLDLENLRYKESYLQSEIRKSRNLNTPQLNKIEKEVGKSLGTLVHSADLDATHSQSIAELQAEQTTRIDTNKLLEDTTQRNSVVVEVLDRKRKFLEELPAKVEVLAGAARELEGHFTAIAEDS